MMWIAFLRVAMRSPGRQHAFRRTVVLHLLLVGAMVLIALPPRSRPDPVILLGHLLLVAGIVEGAALLGWRLAQMPKSQALEFLLVSPVNPRRVFLGEALAGLGRLALVQLASLPLLGLLVIAGRLQPVDVMPLLVMPFTWGVVTASALTVWAYESAGIRRWGELGLLLAVLVYLGVGLLAGEKLVLWLQQLRPEVARVLWNGFRGFHQWNPFSVMEYWLQAANPDRVGWIAWERLTGLQIGAMLAVSVLFTRAAWRLKGHFHDRHYKPLHSNRPSEVDRIGDQPLSWWAVRRVMEYSGRINLWLAGGFGLLYAAYLLAGSAWPTWMGVKIFVLLDTRMGGVAGLTTGLVVLAAVPAAFQYGLWDPGVAERCRRLELLLLTDLDGHDYWNAATAAAWRRGRGYFLLAALLWLAGWYAGRADLTQVLATASAATILWGVHFVVGFRAFASGLQANGLGSVLTLGLPLAVYALVSADLAPLAVILPPGAVYLGWETGPTLGWAGGPIVLGVFALVVARRSLQVCESDLRRWYDAHQGRQSLDT